MLCSVYWLSGVITVFIICLRYRPLDPPLLLRRYLLPPPLHPTSYRSSYRTIFRSVTGTQGGLGDSQWKSPFDTCPCTTSPVSLTNLQVFVGGQNVLQSTLQYGYEHFLEQVNLAEQLTSSDFGISTGLINQNYWENSKWYYVNVERGNAADKLNGRNIHVSFTNNSNVPIEVMVFIFYSDEIAIDVKTGLVTRHKN